MSFEEMVQEAADAHDVDVKDVINSLPAMQQILSNAAELGDKVKGSSGSTWKRDESAVGDTGLPDYAVTRHDKRKVAALTKANKLLGKGPNDKWSSKEFLDCAKIKINGKVSAFNSLEETYCKELEDVDLRPLSELPKMRNYVVWYEKLWAKVKVFFTFVFGFWEVRKRRKELDELRSNLNAALTHHDLKHIVYDRQAGRPEISNEMLKLDAIKREKTREAMSEGGVGGIRRRRYD